MEVGQPVKKALRKISLGKDFSRLEDDAEKRTETQVENPLYGQVDDEGFEESGGDLVLKDDVAEDAEC